HSTRRWLFNEEPSPFVPSTSHSVLVVALQQTLVPSRGARCIPHLRLWNDTQLQIVAVSRHHNGGRHVQFASISAGARTGLAAAMGTFATTNHPTEGRRFDRTSRACLSRTLASSRRSTRPRDQTMGDPDAPQGQSVSRSNT